MKTRRYQILSEDHWDEYGERIIVLDLRDGRKFYANRKDFDRSLGRETMEGTMTISAQSQTLFDNDPVYCHMVHSLADALWQKSYTVEALKDAIELAAELAQRKEYLQGEYVAPTHAEVERMMIEITKLNMESLLWNPKK